MLTYCFTGIYSFSCMQVSLFGETVTAQKLMFEKCGNDLQTHLATRVLPAVDCPPNIADRPPNIADHICLHIQVDMLVGKLIDSYF
jgi:hypothetical protein